MSWTRRQLWRGRADDASRSSCLWWPWWQVREAELKAVVKVLQWPDDKVSHPPPSSSWLQARGD